ncbi:MAG: hypothetical protein AB7N76_02645 [Planctomycetota bacterium]
MTSQDQAPEEDSSLEEIEMPEAHDEPSDEDSRTMVLDVPQLPGPHANRDGFGGPEDESGEHPLLVVGADDGSDELPRLGGSGGEEDDDEPALSAQLVSAYEYLDIHTPLQEFESYARARLEAQVRVGNTEQAEVTAAALKLGLDALRRVMGASREGTQ